METKPVPAPRSLRSNLRPAHTIKHDPAPPPVHHHNTTMPASPSHPSPAPATPSSSVDTPSRRRRLLPSKSKPNQSSTPTFEPPSPFHRFLPSPLPASSVPFSWEHRPGIPKTPARNRQSLKGAGKTLPLPPSLLSRACTGGGADPYSCIVLAEYAAMHPPPEQLQRGRAGRLGWSVRGRSCRPRLGNALAEWLSVLSLCRSCKRAAACFAAKAKSSVA
ncbi:vegetative cell wall protein gp1-like [Phragmites australis]|uniref:vegetative cell wall protein gp1-like n=1 Tax=Phragmites australis TaxID=29695 RepID=UPI002D77DD3E|nr:vegetative cell wall protein gp1-like [Phragmites australis]